MPKVTAHLTRETLSECNARGSVSGAINRMVSRYVETCKVADIERQFTPDEIDALRDALSGWTDCKAESIGGAAATAIKAAIDGGIEGRQSVDMGQLLDRLQSLGYAQNCALIDSVERYWKRVADAHGEKPDSRE